MCLRSVCGVTHMDQVRNKEVQRELVLWESWLVEQSRVCWGGLDIYGENWIDDNTKCTVKVIIITLYSTIGSEKIITLHDPSFDFFYYWQSLPYRFIWNLSALLWLGYIFSISFTAVVLVYHSILFWYIYENLSHKHFVGSPSWWFYQRVNVIYHRMYDSSFQTGTLTEDGLDMRGVVPVLQTASKVELSLMTSARILPHDHLLFAMATCHSITVINLEKVRFKKNFVLMS